MKRKVFIGMTTATVCLVMFVIFSSFKGMNPSGSPAGYTGSPGDTGNTCANCHGGSAQTATGWITSNVPAAGYTAGTAYQITVTVTGSGKKGFEVSPQTISGALVGTLTAGTGTKIVGSKYVTQSSGVNTSTATWNFTWSAPAAGTGDVTLYGAYCVGMNITKKGTLVVQENSAVVVYAGADQIVCNNSANLFASNPAPNTGTWTVVAGTGTFENANLYNTLVTNLGSGLNTFRWTVNGVSDDVNITSNYFETTTGGDQTVSVDYATLTATIPAGVTGTWSLISGSGVFDNPNSPNTTVRQLAFGVNLIRWTATSGLCSVFDDITITCTQYSVYAGADQIVCTEFTFLVATNPASYTGTWSVIAGSGLIENPTYYITSVTGLSYGVNTFRWTVNGVFDDVNVTYTGFTVSAGESQTVTGDTAVLSASLPDFAAGMWTRTGGAGIIDNPTQQTTVVRQLAFGANRFRWTASAIDCSTFDEVVITRNTQVNAGLDLEGCNNNVQLFGSDPSPLTGTWSVIAGSGTFANENAPSTAVTNLSLGTNTFRWTVSGVSDDVNVMNNSVVANAGADQLNITGTDAVMQAVLPIDVTGLWTVLSGNAVVQNAANPTSVVNNLSVGDNTFLWTVTKGTCTSSDDVLLSTVANITANAGLDQNTCINQAIMGAQEPALGQGVWTVISGTVTIANPNSHNTQVLNLSFGANTFRWTITYGNQTASDDVVVTYNKPTANYNTDNQSLEVGTTIQFTNTSANGNTYLWDFGDGITSTEQNPTHTYTTANAYNVTLIVSSESCSDTATNSITIKPLSINELQNKGQFSILPNPSQGEFSLQLNQTFQNQILVKIYTVSGQVVFSKEYKNYGINAVIPINISNAKKGNYIVEIQSGSEKIREKLILN